MASNLYALKGRSHLRPREVGASGHMGAQGEAPVSSYG